ncbi:HDOD domain-containing protein [Candidatus Hydrogenedentota bacterium]
MMDRAEILSKIKSVRPISVVVTRLMTLMDDPDISFTSVADVVQYDPGLSANMLKVVNSVKYGARSEIGSVRDALVRLGMKEVTRIVFVVSTRSTVDKPVEGYELNEGELWRRSVAVACAAEEIEKMLDSGMADVAFTAGLLHSIGKLVLAESVRENITSIEKVAEENNISFEEAEQDILGMDSCEAGALTLEQWSFPPQLVEAIRWHQGPDSAEEPDHLTDVVHIASAIASMAGVGVGRDGLQHNASPGAMTRLGLKTIDLEMVASKMMANMTSILESFDDPKGGE